MELWIEVESVYMSMDYRYDPETQEPLCRFCGKPLNAQTHRHCYAGTTDPYGFWLCPAEFEYQDRVRQSLVADMRKDTEGTENV